MSRALSGRRLICLGAIALLAAGLVLLTTRHGLGTSPDGAVYIGVARSVVAGHGLNVPIHFYPLGKVSIGTPPLGQSSPAPTPLVIYAPLEPVLLAIGGHPVGAARVENSIFFALTVLLAGLVVLVVTKELWLAVAGQLVIAFSLVDTIGPQVGTEPVALFLTVAALSSVIYFLRHPRFWWLTAAALFIGLATLVRFAAGGLIVWGVIALWRQRRDAVALLVMSSAPLAAWFAYEQISGRTTGHFLGVHVTADLVREGGRSIGNWVLPANAPTALAAVGALVVLVCGFLIARRNRGSVPRLLVLFAVVQVAILVIAHTFVDAGVDLEPREFIYMFVALVMAAACSIPSRKPFELATWIVVALCVLRGGVDVISNPVSGFSPNVGKILVHAPIMADVRALPPNSIIYSNAPDAIYLLADRATSSIPERIDFSTLKENPRFGAQLTEIRNTLLNRGGFVVFVRGLPRDSFLPNESILKRLLSLQVVRNSTDGAIYRIMGKPAPKP